MRTVNAHYQEKFGCKVYKLSLDGGFTCPNRDGRLGYGGCRFCSEFGGGEFAAHPQTTIAAQLESARERVRHKNKSGKYIAYFQSFTGTYAPLPRLEALYTQALEPEDVVGLAIGTRPDCLPPETVALLARLNKQKPVSVELGLQTIHDSTARWFGRGYDTGVYDDALRRLKEAGIEVVTHLILGLPGETPEMMAASTRHAVAAGTDGIKFHLLHVLQNTRLARDYEAGVFRCMTMEEYGDALMLCLRDVPETVTVHRITGDGAKRDLIAPLWSADKKRVLNYLNHRLQSPEP